MTTTINTVVINSQDIDDEALKTAILASRPFNYLQDLKQRIADHFGNPELATDRDFGYRIYCLNRDIEEETTNTRIGAAGFFRPSIDKLDSLIGAKLEMLLGLDSILGERVIEGTIKKDANGKYLFIPKGRRTRGYLPGLIRRKQPLLAAE